MNSNSLICLNRIQSRLTILSVCFSHCCYVFFVSPLPLDPQSGHLTAQMDKNIDEWKALQASIAAAAAAAATAASSK